MKKLLPCLLFLFGLVAMSSSCNNKVKTEKPTVVVNKKAEPSNIDDKKEMTPHNMEEDCHGVRKTIHTLDDKEGEIMLIGNNITISIPPEGTTRYKICDVAKELKVEGLKVRFSGEVLEIFRNERLMGTPLRLSEIDIVK